MAAAGRVAFDLLVLRPLELVQLAVDAAVFVPAAPFALAAGDLDAVTRPCLAQPARRALSRPLGAL